MAITQNASFENRTPHADFFFSCQPNSSNPWPSISAAHAGITPAYRSGGKIIFITIDGEVIPHMYQGGVNEANLLPLPSGKSAASSNIIPKTTVEVLRAGTVPDPIVYITNGKREGFFKYDANDSTSTDDGVLTVLVGTGPSAKRYKRIFNGPVFPSWWGIDETGTTTVGNALNTVFLAAFNAGTSVEANGTYLIDEPYPNASPFFLYVRTNLTGTGTFKTRNNGALAYANHNIIISNITVDGSNGTTNVGRGVFNDGYSGCTAFNVKSINTVSQGFWWWATNNAKITHCTTRNNIGIGGDGIYVARASNVQISDNLCTEFERIGISCEGNDTGFNYTRDAVVTGNIVKNAIPSQFESANYPNGGIWLENIAGCTVSNNRIENTYFRGISVTPSIASTDIKYSNIIEGNTIKNCHKIDVASGPAYGISVVFGFHTTTEITNNTLIDCQRYIGIGDNDEVLISNNIFKVEIDSPANVSALITIDFLRLASPTRKTKVVIDNCINSIDGLPGGRSIVYPNVTNQRADLEVRDCKGNFSTCIAGAQVVDGNFTFINCTLDWGDVNTANALVFNITGKVLFQDCTIKLGGPLFPYCEELEFNNTYCYADMATNWTQYLTGFRVLKVLNGSRFKNVNFFNIRRANTEVYFYDSSFDGYPASQGLFVNTVILVSRLETAGCKYSETITSTSPLSFAFGVTTVIVGENFYATAALMSITTVMPEYKQYRNFTHTSAQKPTVPQLGHLHFNTTTTKWERWNGTVWDTSTSFIVVGATTAPTKSGLNTTYGDHRAGSIISYPNQAGGAKLYQKLADGNTSDWNIVTPSLLA